MLIISISVQNATVFFFFFFFSKKRHALGARACERTCIHTRARRKQKLHTHNYTFLHLTQLHVSQIIRQRLDNPDRNPFSFPQPPCKFSFCNIVFSQYPDNQRPFKDLKFLDSEIRPVGFTFDFFFFFFFFFCFFIEAFFL